MVRIFAPIFTALALSSAVLAVPMMNARTEHGEPAAAPAASGSSSSAMAEATSTSAAMVHDTTTSAAHGSASTTTAMGHEASTTSAAMHDVTTTSAAMHDATSTSTAAAHTTTSSPSYGSGYNNWGTDLNSCVQMCQAKFGMSSASAPPPSTTTAAPPAAGTGATHTVIVAPTKGVLRYVPFAVNASVGDTVRFMWGAGPHTVTKSSALTVCNKSADASSFASGQQNASFVFDQVVNTTEPTFFYCAVPNHCQKGMFGIINPPNAAGAASSVGMMMSTWTSQNPDLAKMQTAVDSATVGTPAYNWASNLDVSSIPTEAHQSIVENIFYTRLFYAANTGASEGASRPDGQPLSIPSDVNTLLSNSAGNPAGASGAPAGGVPSGTPTSTPSSAAVSASPSANGAASVVSSSALIAVVAIISSLFLI